MKKFLLSGVLLSSLFSLKSFALDASDFNGLEGFSVAAVTRVDGDFEGCDFDKKIHLQNGWILTCQNYNYQYAYSPEVAVLVENLNGGYAVKAVIGDEIYDMQPILKKR